MLAKYKQPAHAHTYAKTNTLHNVSTYIDRDTSIYTNVKETTQVLKLKEGITYDDKAFK